MGRIALLALILLSIANSGHADETSVAGGSSARCPSCAAPQRLENPLASPAVGSSVFVSATQAETAGGSTGFFPVLPHGQRQFEVDSSKLRGQRFHWYAP